jgi:simple sugar transport system permease protein
MADIAETRAPLMGRLLRNTEAYLLVVIVAIVVLLGIATPNFLSLSNILGLVNGYSVTAVLAAGLLVVLISGNIDISFGATTMVAQYLAALFIIGIGGGWETAFGLAILVGILLGCVNALLVHYLRASSIIVTIATMNVFFGLLMFFSGGRQLFRLPAYMRGGIIADIPLGDGSLRISIQMLTVLIVFLITWLILKHSSVGRQIYAMGGNPEAAKRLGFSLLRLNLFVYAYLGAMAGVAAIIHAQLQQQVAPNVLVGRELDVLAAVVLGGASLLGGIGTVGGTILGIALLAILQNGLILIGVSSYWLQVCTGLVILVAVCVTAFSDRMKLKRSVRGVV